MEQVLDKYIGVEQRLDEVRDQFALVEGHYDSSEETSPWIPFIPNIWLRHLTFDVRNGVSVHIMRADKGGSLGRHRHRATVTGFVLKGSLRYLEYDWVARAGDYIHESPGRTHTLHSDEGMETLFHLGTPIEFLDEQDRIVEIVDVFWMIDHYLSYCKENNLPVNKSMFI
ncbi:2,4'-dihydroxyacetophenone dioxygenase family protein [Enemella sp. A6]|uniref:2,4'-dihydroxyacetophenone dioxygenase family protein n=1 Tax=Enemella sp. A6 TaxID=3440152 RepID=UPI003EB912E6